MEYFNLNWFKANKDSLDRIINFWREIFWLMQYSNCRMKIYDYAKYKLAKFWIVSDDQKSFVKLNLEIRIMPDGTIDMPKEKALKNPYVWLIAWRLKYWQFPKKWHRISKWKRNEFIRYCVKVKENNENFAVYFYDAYGNHVLVPKEVFDEEFRKLLEEHTPK